MKKIKNGHIWKPVICGMFFIVFVAAIYILFCHNKKIETIQQNFSAEDFKHVQNLVYRKKLGNGDAKFYDEHWIMTSVNGKLRIISIDGKQEKEYEDVNVNWFTVEQGDKTVVYSNARKEVGILRLDDDMNVITNNIIYHAEDLPIDPSIIKIGGEYFITVTYINGAVNNSDKDTDNGVYTIKLYASADLENFECIGDVLSDKKNLEDIVPFYREGKYYLFFEREEIDKGASSLEVTESGDNGVSWSEPIKLCALSADNELGNVLFDNNCFALFFSSDYLNPGTSYDGASIFVSYFDEEFHPLQTNKKIAAYYGGGVAV